MSVVKTMIGDKRRYRKYKARTKELPVSYRTAADALERYLLYFGPNDGDRLNEMLEDLANLLEQSVADEITVRAVVGEDPVEFAETFLRNYPGGSWISKERDRLAKAIDKAEAGRS